jgi:hypothetical protein
MACDETCGESIVTGLEAYIAGSGDDELVATLLSEFKGSTAQDDRRPSLWPSTVLYHQTLYPSTSTFRVLLYAHCAIALSLPPSGS